MSRHERTIQFFDLDISGRTRAHIDQNLKKFASPRTLDQLMHEFVSIREKNMARRKAGQRSTYQFSLEDIDEKENCWVLLINLVDSGASNVVTNRIDGSDQDRNTIEFSDDQGLESSAHIVIFKKQNRAKKHLTLFEKAPGVPFIKASSFLNYLAKLAAQDNPLVYDRPHPSGAANSVMKTYCALTLFAHPSEQFKSELVSGKINDLRITSDAVMVKGYDANAPIELIGTEVKVNVSRSMILRSGGNWGHLQQAIRHAKTLDMPYVRVSFEDETGSGHTATLSTDTEYLYNKDKYVKKRKIGNFSKGLATAVPIISNEIVLKMVEIADD